MRMSAGAIALLALVLGAGTPPSFSGAAAGTAEEDAGSVSSTQQRVEERRRQREGQRRWISVPQKSVAETLAVMGEPGVVIIDVTCRERGANYPDRIPGAVWRDCTKVEQWAGEYEGAKTILVYCA